MLECDRHIDGFGEDNCGFGENHNFGSFILDSGHVKVGFFGHYFCGSTLRISSLWDSLSLIYDDLR